MKLLILTDLTFPCDHSFLEEVYTKRFTEKGWDVSWIMRCSQKEYFEHEKHVHMWNGTPVYIIPSDGVRTIKSLLITSFYTFKNVWKLINKIEWDIIQVRNDPLMGLLALINAKIRKRKFTYQYTFYKSEGNKFLNGTASKIKAYGGRLIERIIIKYCDIVFTISEAMKNELIAQGISKNKLVPLPLGVDEKLSTNKQNMMEIKRNYNLGNYIVTYIGTMNAVRKLSFLVDVYESVKKRVPEAQFLFVGDAVNPDDVNCLKKEFYRRGFTEREVIFVGRVPRKVVYDYLMISNVCVSPIPPIPIFRIASPIKLMDYLNCGKPVVGNKGILEQEEILISSQGGYCVEYEKSNFSEAIINLLNDRVLADKLGNKGRDYIRKHRSYTVLADKLEAIYMALQKRDGEKYEYKKTDK